MPRRCPTMVDADHPAVRPPPRRHQPRRGRADPRVRRWHPRNRKFTHAGLRGARSNASDRPVAAGRAVIGATAGIRDEQSLGTAAADRLKSFAIAAVKVSARDEATAGYRSSLATGVAGPQVDQAAVDSRRSDTVVLPPPTSLQSANGAILQTSACPPDSGACSKLEPLKYADNGTGPAINQWDSRRAPRFFCRSATKTNATCRKLVWTAASRWQPRRSGDCYASHRRGWTDF